MTNLKAPHPLLLIVATTAFATAVWGVARFMFKHPATVESTSAAAPLASDPGLWTRSVEKIKEDRGETGNVAIEIPTELRHYDERRWFLATQVAEVKKVNLQPVQDFVDLAAMVRRGEMVPLPAVTDTYILFGVGARVNGDAFTRYVANQNLELNDEAGLLTVAASVAAEHTKLQKEISNLQDQLSVINDNARTKHDELERAITALQQELKSNEADQKLIDQYYELHASSTAGSPKLLRDYDSLQTLAKNFGGRGFNLDDSSDRQTLKVYLLSSLRPQALKVLEETAKRYHDKFDRPLPVSSLVRPEQYQHLLRRVNRNAVLINTPPHSTGLAFDIDYRYMSNAEQNFVMSDLARMKVEGRIEVIRERGANYHVFVFIDGRRPSDDLIKASLDEVGPPPTEGEADQAQSKQTSARVRPKSSATKNSALKTKGSKYPGPRKKHLGI